MQVFELYFNPKDESKISESFQYKPKNAYEGKLGRLYMVGEIVSPEKKDSAFLQNIFHKTKEIYYKDASLSPETAFKKTLKETNSFLRTENFNKDLNIALFSCKNFSLYLSKLGNAQIKLISSGKIINIGAKITENKSSLFSSMITGKMQKKDKLIVSTPEIEDLFEREKIAEDIIKTPVNSDFLKKISKILEDKTKGVSGNALIIDHNISLKEGEKTVIAEKRSKKFSFKKMFTETFSSLIKLKEKKSSPKLSSLKKIKKISPNSLSLKKLKSLKLNFPQIRDVSLKEKPLLLPLLLIGVVLLGTLVIGVERNIRFGKEEEKLLAIEERIDQKYSENNILALKNIYREIDDLIKKETPLLKSAKELKNNLSERLLALSLATQIEKLDAFHKTSPVLPKGIVFLDNNLYVFSEEESEINVIDTTNGKERVIPTSTEGVSFATSSSGKVLFFSPPETIITLEGTLLTSQKVNSVDEYDRFIDLASFFGRPYFLSIKGEIFRIVENRPAQWLTEPPANTSPTSLAIDGSIFVFTKEGVVRYHEGEKREIIRPTIFPPFPEEGKIKTNTNSPLYILDKSVGRVIVLNKNGDVTKQLFNEKIRKANDIAVTPDGKKIYLLISQEVYEIEINF